MLDVEERVAVRVLEDVLQRVERGLGAVRALAEAELGAVRPVDVHLQVDQVGIGLGEQDVVEAHLRLVGGEGELLGMVVLVELHAALTGGGPVRVEVVGRPLPAVDRGAVAEGARRRADVLEAEGLGVVEDLLQVLGEGVGAGVVVVVVADVAADRVEAVVLGQPLELGQRDGAGGALGVAGQFDLVVAVLLQLGEDGGEAERGDLVAEAVELDAEAAGGQDGLALAVTVAVVMPVAVALAGALSVVPVGGLGCRRADDRGGGRSGGDTEDVAAAQSAGEFGVLGGAAHVRVSPLLT
ncbi:hypothetical protein SCYAM73S_07584 [Streptomyces cyaneofuscatus]